MYQLNPEQTRIIIENKCLFRFSTANTASGVPEVTCYITDKVTDEVFIQETGPDHEKAFNKAIAKIKTATRPYATEEAKKLAEKDAEIAALRAQLKPRKNSNAPEPSAA